MKKLLMSVLAVGALSALAETSPMENPAWGYQITGLANAPDDVVCVFTNAAADAGMTWSVPNGVETFQFLVVGGGGSGGGNKSFYGAGGGGAGGVVTGYLAKVSLGSVFSVSVGAGGAKTGTGSKAGNTGKASELKMDTDHLIVAYGGGGGGKDTAAGAAGGSGGGAGTKSGSGGNATSGSVTGFDLEKGVASEKGYFDAFGSNGGSSASSRAAAGGGGAGGAGGNGTSATVAGKGGDGIFCGITGENVRYAGGGGGGASYNNGKIGAGGAGGGGSGGGRTSNEPKAGTNGLGGGGGGGGGASDTSKYSVGAAGGSGVVIVRYTAAADVAECPRANPKVYAGEEQSSDLAESGKGWDLVSNATGTEVGTYFATIKLAEGFNRWDDAYEGDERQIEFQITPAENAWTVDPFVSSASWFSGDTGVTLVNGETTWGPTTATYTLNGEERGAFSFDVIPTEAGDYVVTCTVLQSKNWTDPEPLTKTVSFTVVDKSGTPPFDVTVSAITPKVADDKLTVDIAYALSSEIASENTVTLKALYSCDPAMTNEAVLATDVALDASGTVTLGAELASDTNYVFLVYGESEDGVFSPMDDTRWREVKTPGPATGLAATAVYSAEKGGFVISGMVVPGLGTTTVTVRWALNSKELDQQQTFDFAFGADGAFAVTVPSGVTDGLNWTVVSSNEFGGVSWNQDLGEQPVVYPPARDCAWAGEDGMWSVAANWTDNAAPCSNDRAFFTNGTSTVTIDANTDVSSPAVRTLSVTDGANVTFIADGDARTFATYDSETSSPTLVGANSILAFSGANLTAGLGAGSAKVVFGNNAKFIADDGANVTVNNLSYGGSSVTLMATNQATLTCATTATAEPDGWTFLAMDGGTLDLSKVTLKSKKFALKAVDGTIDIYSMPSHDNGTAFYLDNGVINVKRVTNVDTDSLCLGSHTSRKTIALDFRGNRSSIVSPNCKIILSNKSASGTVCTINLHPDGTWDDSVAKFNTGTDIKFNNSVGVVVNVDVNGLKDWHGKGDRKMVIKLFKGSFIDFGEPAINLVGDEKVRALTTVKGRREGNAYYIDIEKKSGLGFAVIIK